MRKTRRRPDVYIRSLREDVRDDMTALDALLSKEMKGLPRVMWEDAMWGGTQQAIIGYGDYRSQRSDKIEVNWFVVGLTAQKKYLSVYVNAVEDGRYLAETFASELGDEDRQEQHHLQAPERCARAGSGQSRTHGTQAHGVGGVAHDVPAVPNASCAPRLSVGGVHVRHQDCGRQAKIGGGGGIRTHGALASTTVFETAPIGHSGTPPRPWRRGAYPTELRRSKEIGSARPFAGPCDSAPVPLSFCLPTSVRPQKPGTGR